jgi:hypothetical protein
MRRQRWLLAVVVLAVLIVPQMAGAQSAQTVARGAVIGLQGTPHLWIGGDDGSLHWAGDTRALADRFVDWNSRKDVTLDQLKGYQLGDPWLSAGLLKVGDPIYLVKWEANAGQPVLLQIQSIPDVELFGINGGNYGKFVMDRATWEQRFDFKFDSLQKSALTPAIPPTPTPTPVVTATPTYRLKATDIETQRTGGQDAGRRVFNTIEISGAQPHTLVYVSLAYEEWDCSPLCEGTSKGTWGPKEVGRTDAKGVIRFTDDHGAYKSYTYTFKDEYGTTATLEYFNDLNG